jgi:hypothetical protein
MIFYNMKNSIKNMKKLIIAVFIGSLIFFACQQPEPQKVFTGDKQFRTTDPSRIYFKNMRQVYYYLENRKGSKVNIFWLRKYTKTKVRPIIYPKIVNDWLEDEAYIFIENGFYPYFQEDSLQLMWSNTEQDTSGILTLEVRSKKNQYEFAGKLYERLVEGDDFRMVNNQLDTVAIFEDRDDRIHFVTTMKDYYRLTEVY